MCSARRRTSADVGSEHLRHRRTCVCGRRDLNVMLFFSFAFRPFRTYVTVTSSSDSHSAHDHARALPRVSTGYFAWSSGVRAAVLFTTGIDASDRVASARLGMSASHPHTASASASTVVHHVVTNYRRSKVSHHSAGISSLSSIHLAYHSG
jgi:hypothetical protein